jgi:hypothetical protein
MTEAKWLSCDDPRLMLDHLRDAASPRKLRWFACACVRSVWSHLIDERSQRAVEVAELYADGRAESAALAEAESQAFEVARAADLRSTVSDPAWAASRAAARAASYDAFGAATGSAFIAALCFAPWAFDKGTVAHHGDPVAKAEARRRQCRLLRDVLGNPFRAPSVSPDWLSWNDGTVLRLARHVYQDCRFDALPILGDALEDAGCTDETLLSHCHEPGEHVRGCWVVDLCLGKQ